MPSNITRRSKTVKEIWVWVRCVTGNVVGFSLGPLRVTRALTRMALSEGQSTLVGCAP